MNKAIPISVYLRPSSEYRMLFCMMCRGGMQFRIEGVPKLIIPSDITNIDEVLGEKIKPLQFPIKFRCSKTFDDGQRCPALYIIQGFVTD